MVGAAAVLAAAMQASLAAVVLMPEPTRTIDALVVPRSSQSPARCSSPAGGAEDPHRPREVER
ncbi:hypothetical protein ACFYNZ_04590 [Streptomyces kebangsaanensis]|uniref:Uncharacterized protein n=1 Tax=Streptomyces kebangsaanensis TaxID=864058 RepID=A0ABW6KN39_9ACTN